MTQEALLLECSQSRIAASIRASKRARRATTTKEADARADSPRADGHAARAFARAHAPSTRTGGKGIAVPWNSFERDRFLEAALALSHDAQRMLALGEYSGGELVRAIRRRAHARWRAVLDLLSVAARVPQDEIRHADLAFRSASLCAGREVTVESTEEKKSRWGERLSLEDLDSFAIEVIAIGETLACGLLSACRDGATAPVAHAIYANIVADASPSRASWLVPICFGARRSGRSRKNNASQTTRATWSCKSKRVSVKDATRRVARKKRRARLVCSTPRANAPSSAT